MSSKYERKKRKSIFDERTKKARRRYLLDRSEKKKEYYTHTHTHTHTHTYI